MKILLLVTASVLSCGFIVNTPDARRELERTRQHWHHETTARYDRKALHAFLVNSISDVSTIKTMRLNDRPTGSKFRPAKDRFYWESGQWLFVTKDPTRDEFELRGYMPGEGWAVLRCKRESPERFTVVDVEIDPIIVLDPPPYSSGP